jgi:hypothetical protein
MFHPRARANTQLVLGGDDRAEALPLELEGPPRAGGQWARDGKASDRAAAGDGR